MNVPNGRPTIVWFRKDLRVRDNAALKAATERGGPVIAIYIREDDSGTGPLGAAQGWWLHHSLAALSGRLGTFGIPLLLRSGGADTVLDGLVEETGAGAVHWNRRYDPPGIAIDTRIKTALKARGITATSFAGQLLHEPTRLLTGDGGPFRVYTPFWKAFERQGEPLPPVDLPETVSPAAEELYSETLSDWGLLPTAPDWAAEFQSVWTPGEAGAEERLDIFLDGAIRGYGSERDKPDGETTSLLSPHLALGEIAPARVWQATQGLDAPGDDIVHFRKELVWREFSYHLLFHFPDLATKNWNDRFDDFPWQREEGHFRLWTRGMTGYPIVDAGMRQLWRHGWMHNRVRMIAASFLIKHLMIDWRRGEAWFRDTLVDADPASNAASWQWVAGSGADASPFFRIFNPMLQGEKFDPEGAYVRTFVPELADLDAAYIHKPFAAPKEALKRAGITLGDTYPEPIVDHGRARERALAAFKRTKPDV